MGDWSLNSGTYGGLAGTLTAASSYGVHVTTSVANTKGSWFEIVPAASALPECRAFLLSAELASAAAWDTLFDVGIGGAGSEIVVVSNAGFNSQAVNVGLEYYFPLLIPASTRVAVRMQSGNATVGINFGITLLPGSFGMASGLTGASAEGADTTVSGGQSVTPGSNTKGSYTQITASTARNYKGIALHRFTKNTTIASQTNLVDVAIGGAGSEKIIVADVQLGSNSSTQGTPFLPIEIPAGVRLAVRAAGSTVTAWGASILGFY